MRTHLHMPSLSIKKVCVIFGYKAAKELAIYEIKTFIILYISFSCLFFSDEKRDTYYYSLANWPIVSDPRSVECFHCRAF